MTIKSNTIRRCIVKDSLEIRSILESRFTELSLYGRDIVADAKKHGYDSISASTLSRYRTKGNIKGTLSQEDIIWLCYRYGVELKLTSAQIVPYDEKKLLKRLKKEF